MHRSLLGRHGEAEFIVPALQAMEASASRLDPNRQRDTMKVRCRTNSSVLP